MTIPPSRRRRSAKVHSWRLPSDKNALEADWLPRPFFLDRHFPTANPQNWSESLIPLVTERNGMSHLLLNELGRLTNRELDRRVPR